VTDKPWLKPHEGDVNDLRKLTQEEINENVQQLIAGVIDPDVLVDIISAGHAQLTRLTERAKSAQKRAKQAGAGKGADEVQATNGVHT